MKLTWETCFENHNLFYAQIKMLVHYAIVNEYFWILLNQRFQKHPATNDAYVCWNYLKRNLNILWCRICIWIAYELIEFWDENSQSISNWISMDTLRHSLYLSQSHYILKSFQWILVNSDSIWFFLEWHPKPKKKLI